jgi:Domain of unknown function (DUF309)
MTLHHVETPFYQRQPTLPLVIQRFLRARVEAAMHDPARREDLAWATVLGAPAIREQHPLGLPEPLLFAHAAKMLAAVGRQDPESAWREHLERYSDAAQRGEKGWMPHASWGAWGPLVSLRSGWQLAALTPLPTNDRYALACGVSLFNHALYHECHDALEPLWVEANGDLKQGLQGLILMTAGYHHQQLHNAAGMKAVFEESLARLATFDSHHLQTPWGRVDFSHAWNATKARLAWLSEVSDDGDLGAIWSMEQAFWELP